MAKKDIQPPQKITLGRSGQIKTDVPAMGGGGGKIQTNFSEIKWTRKNKAIVAVGLGFPYGFALVACFGTGAYIGGYMLLGLLAIMGMVLLALRLIDRSEF